MQCGANAPGEGAYRLAGKLKRERERERCDSAMLAHLASVFSGRAAAPGTNVPLELTLNHSLIDLTRSLSQDKNPANAV
jgi:hypothetical protein